MKLQNKFFYFYWRLNEEGINHRNRSYLAELLCEKGYKVFGMLRRASLPNTNRINYLIDSSFGENIELLDGDLTDTSSIYRCLNEVEPDEVYNLGAQSHVGVSFANPEYTADVDALGTLRILEGIRCLNMGFKTKHHFLLLNFLAWDATKGEYLFIQGPVQNCIHTVQSIIIM